MMVHWLGLHIFIAEGLGSIPDQETKILLHLTAKKRKKSWYFNWILFQEECLCVRWFNRAEGVNSGLAISAYYRVVKCRVEI